MKCLKSMMIAHGISEESLKDFLHALFGKEYTTGGAPTSASTITFVATLS